MLFGKRFRTTASLALQLFLRLAVGVRPPQVPSFTRLLELSWRRKGFSTRNPPLQHCAKSILNLTQPAPRNPPNLLFEPLLTRYTYLDLPFHPTSLSFFLASTSTAALSTRASLPQPAENFRSARRHCSIGGPPRAKESWNEAEVWCGPLVFPWCFSLFGFSIVFLGLLVFYERLLVSLLSLLFYHFLCSRSVASFYFWFFVVFFLTSYITKM